MIKAEWTNKDSLELQPTCNQLATDTISRQAAIDAVLRAEALVRVYGYRYAADAVRELPSAQPERKTGKWIPLGIRHGWVCSKCRKENVYAFATDESGEYILQDYFCPNCGADMRGKDDGAD